MNKVLVGTAMLTTMAGALAQPVQAAFLQDSVKDAYANSNNITRNHEVSVDSALYNTKQVIKAIENMHVYRVSKMCQVLDVSKSGYYSWLKCKPSKQKMQVIT